MNQFGIRLVALLNDVSVWWHITGVLLIVGVLIFGLRPARTTRRPRSCSPRRATTCPGGTSARFYVLPLGLLLAQYTFTGYDASAHMTEETHNAARSGPRGIVMSILVSLLAGWVLLIGRHLRDPEGRTTRATPTRPGAAGPDLDRPQSGTPAPKLLLLVIIGAQLFCGMSSITANSRMIYAFSRDGALPGSTHLAPGEQADQDADQRDLAGGRRGADPGPAVPVEQRRLRARSPRSPPSACTSPT